MTSASGEVSVVENVVVGQHHGLGKSGRARGELDVDRVVGIETVGDRFHLGHVDALPRRQNLAPARDAPSGCRRTSVRIVDHDMAKVWQALERQLRRRLHGELRRQLGEHGDVVRALEARYDEQSLHTRQTQGVLELTRPVGGIDVDQDGTDTRRCQLYQDPLEVVGRPDTDAVAAPQTERHQSAREPRDLPLELGVGQTSSLRQRDDRLLPRMALCDPAKKTVDRRTDQGLVTAPVHVRSAKGTAAHP